MAIRKERGKVRDFLGSALLVFLSVHMLSFCTSGERTTETSESPAPEYLIDTLTLFDPETYEKSTVFYQVPADLAWIDKTKPISAQIKNSAKGYSLDTVTVYDRETYQVIAMKIIVTPDGE